MSHVPSPPPRTRARRTFKVTTIVVKPKQNQQSMRRFALATRGGGGDPLPSITSLLDNGYLEHASPVFAAPGPMVDGATRGLRAMRSLSAAMSDPNAKNKNSKGLMALKVAPGEDPHRIAAELAKRGSEFEYAYVPPVKYLCEPKLSAKAKGDPLFNRQWAHGAVKIMTARARKGFKDSTAIAVSVVDSGVDKDHPDLDAAVKIYENFLAAHEDDHDAIGHGTHVSGIIAAERNNAVGVAGICRSPIHNFKGLPRDDFWDAQAYYRALAHPLNTGARVLNLSLGGGVDPGERDVIADLIDGGVVVVAAMGNEYEEGNPVEYPGAYPGVIAVGATDEMDRRGSFSNTGAHIALCAPGVRILSTVPHYPCQDSNVLNFDAWDGTSMATPHVAAAAALVLAKRPGLKPAQVRKILMDSADKVPGQTGWNKEYGAGRLNIDAALKIA